MLAPRPIGLAAAFVLAAGAAGCLDPMIFRARVRTIGEVGGAPPAAVAADSVRVFMDSAPPGIAKGDDEPVVEKGYRHRVIGRVEVKTEDGDCEMEPGESPGKHILREMQRAAAASGGNAIVYAWTKLGPDTTSHDLNQACPFDFAPGSFVWIDQMVWGRGWVVALAE